MYNNGVGSAGGVKPIFSSGEGYDLKDLNKDGVVSEEENREVDNAFEEALGRDKTQIKKEMGEEGLKELERVLNEYEDDPYMLSVKVQDMSDTLIYGAFGRLRNGFEGRGNG